jgi:hypothetical protein
VTSDIGLRLCGPIAAETIRSVGKRYKEKNRDSTGKGDAGVLVFQAERIRHRNKI